MITFLSPSSKDLTGHAPEAFIATSACCTRSYLPMTGYMSFHGGGKGTGRGLAVVYRIVTQQEGHITVHCVPGQETTFSKYLPHIPAVGQQAEKHPQTGEQAGGHETILRTEDDAAVRRLTAAVLNLRGTPSSPL